MARHVPIAGYPRVGEEVAQQVSGVGMASGHEGWAGVEG